MFHLLLIKLIILTVFTKHNLSHPSIQNTASIESTEPNRDSSSNYNTDDSGGGSLSYLANDKIININDPDQNDMIQIKEMNVNLTAIRIQQEQLKSKYRDNMIQVPNNLQHEPLMMRTEESDLNESRGYIDYTDRRQFEEIARAQIRQMLETNLKRDADNGNSQRRLPDDIYHYTAVYPQCNPPKTINTTTFFNSGNTWNLYFSPPASDNPLNAILRLYKLPTSGHANPRPANCSQPEELIRITVSYYIKRREKRKRMCSSQMVGKYFVGWIELDVKLAIKYWNKPTPNQTKKNYGIAIDIQDQEEMPLPAESFFHGYSCEANTSPAIPWNIYEERGTYNIDSSVPKSPRIDYEIHQRGHTMLPYNPSSLSTPNNLYRLMNGGYETETEDYTTITTDTAAAIDSHSRENYDSNSNQKSRNQYTTNNHQHHQRRHNHQQLPNFTTQNSQMSKYRFRK